MHHAIAGLFGLGLAVLRSHSDCVSLFMKINLYMLGSDRFSMSPNENLNSHRLPWYMMFGHSHVS